VISDGSVYNGKPLSMAWQSADGVLSPKITVPRPAAPSSASHTRTSLGSAKSQTSSSSAAVVDEPRTHTTSFSKLLEVFLLVCGPLITVLLVSEITSC